MREGWGKILRVDMTHDSLGRYLPASVLLIGAGRMGGAMLDGWLAAGLPASRVAVIDPGAPASLKARGVDVNPAEPPRAQAVVLAVKPQAVDQAAAALAAHAGPGALLLSVVAGKTLADLALRAPRAGAIVRAMPNTPAAVGRGISALAAGPGLSQRHHDAATALMASVGAVEWLPDEGLMDAVTAVSGSGPAYVFALTEALAAAGAAAGLPADLALRLARATVEGAGELLHRQPDEAPSALREAVTSPGGTTAAALGVLLGDGGLGPLLERAVAAAKERAGELAG